MKVFNIQASKPFLETLIYGIKTRFGSNPILLSSIKIFLPTKRACKNFDEIFLETNNYKPTFIPKTYPIGDLDANEIMASSFANNADKNNDFNQSISEYEERIIFANLINLKFKNENCNIIHNLETANDLIKIYNECIKDEINLDKILELNLTELTIKLSEIKKMLSILAKDYPDYLTKIGKTSPEHNKIDLINRLRILWENNPTSEIIIFAGSTGSVPATRKLIKTVTDLPNGYVVLPSVDHLLDDHSWNKIDYNHPQFMLKQLIDFMGIERKSINEWDQKIVYESNSAFISNFMLPEAVTYKWHSLVKNLSLNNFKILPCETLATEAEIISLMIRESLEKKINKMIVVTNNNNLKTMIIANLKRWEIKIKDPDGNKISETDLGKVFILAAKMIESDFSAIDTLAFLKQETLFEKNLVVEFEKVVFRGLKLKPGIIPILIKIEHFPDLKEFLHNILKKSENLIKLCSKKAEFKEFLKTHIELIENLSNDKLSLYNNHIGESTHLYLSELFKISDTIGRVTFSEYLYIFEDFLSKQKISTEETSYSGVEILNSIDARLVKADLIILAGLNNGIWPSKTQVNQWINKSIRNFLGMHPEEYLASKSAHDFYKLCHMSNVIITYSSYINQEPAYPSKWIIRLETLAEYLGLKANLITNEPWNEIVKSIDQKEPKQLPKIPAPTPKLELRPRKLSVTKIETLIRNPYIIYTSEILKLKPLDSIEKEPNSADFGTIVHLVLESYSKSSKHLKASRELLLSIAESTIKKYQGFYIYPFWLAKLNKICNSFFEYYNLVQTNNNIFSEVSGKLAFESPGGSFILTSKADCILIDTSNNIQILDYKTGSIPSLHECKELTAPQLPLEGIIAHHGGFDCQIQGVNYNLKALTYLLLKANNDDIETQNLCEILNDDFINLSKQYLHNLIAKYDLENTGYELILNNKTITKYQDYQHFCRVKEMVFYT